MVKRIFSSIFGAIFFAIVLPIGYYLGFDSVPFGEFKGVMLLAAVGAVIGAILGYCFPKVFGFIFDIFTDF
ncbi:MAG: hypothetical protein ABF379_08705 [Akkermansiaceae bacterium]|jgi:hypothetical protein